MISDARRHFDRAEGLLTAGGGGQTMCMAEAAAWLGDRKKVARFWNPRGSASDGAVYTDWDGALLFALGWQGWLPEFRALLSNGYMVIDDPSFVPELPVGLQLGLEAYARNGSEEDVHLLNDALRDKEPWLREAWAWSLVREGRVGEIVQEHLRSPNLGRPFLAALRARAFRVDSYDWCRDVELAFPEIRNDFRATCADVWHPQASAPPSTPRDEVDSKEAEVAYALGLRRNLEEWSRFIRGDRAGDKMALERRFVEGLVSTGETLAVREHVLATLSNDATKDYALQLMSMADLIRSVDDIRVLHLPALLNERTEMESLLDGLLDAALSTQQPSWLNRERATAHAARSIAHRLRVVHRKLPTLYEFVVQRRLAWARNAFSTEELPRARAMCRALADLGEYGLARELADGVHDTADRRLCYADIIRAYAIDRNPKVGRRLATPLDELLLIPGVVGSPWSSRPALN
jgi:hypothetical protein